MNPPQTISNYYYEKVNYSEEISALIELLKRDKSNHWDSEFHAKYNKLIDILNLAQHIAESNNL